MWSLQAHAGAPFKKTYLDKFVLISLGKGQHFLNYMVCNWPLSCKKKETLKRIFCKSQWLKIIWAARYRDNTPQSLFCLCKQQGRKYFLAFFFFPPYICLFEQVGPIAGCSVKQISWILKSIWGLIGKECLSQSVLPGDLMVLMHPGRKLFNRILLL